MKRFFKVAAFVSLFMPCLHAADHVPEVTWDRHSLILDGKRVVPVMGEVHYSRIPADEWADEVRKIKDGGVTMIAAYVFWNHIEEVEGVFDWSGQRDLRRFLEVCKDADMPVVLRLGPFCHGEVRNGGIPDWVFTKGCKVRQEDPAFLDYTARLYRQIFSQVQGLQWKDGGPVIGAQFDNEYRGHGSYLMALKQIAEDAGFDLPFYTRTGWPELKTPVPYSELIPLYGDYADGFWDRSIEEGVGNYYKAFNFRQFRNSSAIATEQLGDQTDSSSDAEGLYPYFTCELGGGMTTAYHRRPYIYPEDAYAMAVVKLGSGSNLLGYYMYHGGTNPDGHITTLNENQRTPATNYNDMPVKNYDFQAPLGEFGQTYPHYYMLRKLHLFMKDWGETLAPMEASFPMAQDIPQGDDSALRWSYRCLGDSGFVFVNNYERLQNLSDKKAVTFSVADVTFPSRPITVPAGTSCIFPVNIDGITYATAQPVARRDGKIYLLQIPGIPTEIKVDGKVLKNVEPLGLSRPVYGNIYLLDSETAENLFLELSPDNPVEESFAFRKVSEPGPVRVITKGVQKVAEAPSDSDFDDAARYVIPVPEKRVGKLLEIDYRGDVARIYADGHLVADNFYNGRPMLLGLWRLPDGCKEIELRILPLQPDMPVYFPREADTTPGEEVRSVAVKHLR